MPISQPDRTRRSVRSSDAFNAGLDSIESGIAAKASLLDALACARQAGGLWNTRQSNPGQPRLLAQGDSWFDYGANDLADLLQRNHACAVTSIAVSGSTLDEIVHGALPRGYLGIADAQTVSRAEDLIYALEATRPDAVLLSAGGNDLAGDALLRFVGNSLLSGAGVDPRELRRTVVEVFEAPYRELIGLIQAKAARLGKRLPILLHGYDYPRLSPRAVWAAEQLGAGARGGAKVAFAQNSTSGRTVLGELSRAFVDAFNGLLATLAADHPGAVFHADLRGTLTRATDWANELHPSAQGFALLAGKLDSAVRHALD